MRAGDLERRLRDEPDNLGLRVQLAGVLREMGRGPEAIELYRSVAVAYRDQGRAQQAIAVCKSILEIAPTDAACQQLLASLTESSVKTRAATIPPIDRPRRPPTIQIPPKSRPPTEEPPLRRSSLEATPLPAPVPYHVADPSRPMLAPPPLLDGTDDDAASTLRGMAAMPGEDSEDEITSPRDLPFGALSREAIDGPFFTPLPPERRAAVLARMFKRTVKAGALVIRQGEAMHPLFVIARGLVEVRAERPDGEVVTLGHARDGEYVGEIALLSHAPSTFQVIAATEVDLLALNPKDLFDIAGAFPALWARLKEVSERRTREYDAKMRR